MEQLYCLYLDDYASPSFVSWDKPYYGTLKDIRSLVDALDDGSDHGESIKELISAFRAFEAGNRNVTHHVVYQEVPLLKPVELLAFKTLQKDNHSWEHINTWDSIYSMKCDNVEATLFWLSGPDGCCRVVKACFDNLVYKGSANFWHPLMDGYWGFPEMFAKDGNRRTCRLAVMDKRFDSREQALADAAAPHTVKDVDFTGICNDIFGDG